MYCFRTSDFGCLWGQWRTFKTVGRANVWIVRYLVYLTSSNVRHLQEFFNNWPWGSQGHGQGIIVLYLEEVMRERIFVLQWFLWRWLQPWNTKKKAVNNCSEEIITEWGKKIMFGATWEVKCQIGNFLCVWMHKKRYWQRALQIIAGLH